MRAGRRVGVALVTLAALVHVASFAGTGPIDDDFIVYRYAANALAGDGLVFNVGERVEGFTCPLWLGAIAAGLAAGFEAPVWSVLLGALANAVCVLALWRGWERERGPDSFPLPALLAALSPALAWHGVAGLGTTWLATLLVLWFAAASRAAREGSSVVRAAVWLGLAGLLRPEAVLFAVPWIVFLGRRGLVAMLALVPVGLWGAFRWLYYGRLEPVTYSVKKLPLLADLGYGADYTLFATLQTGALVLLVFAWVAGRRAVGAERAVVRAAAWGLVLHAAYVVAVGGDYLPLARFVVPVLPLLWWLGCRGALEALPRSAWTLAALAALLLPQWTQLQRRELAHWNEAHHARWERLGVRLGEVLDPDASVALSPIGIVGYRSGLEIVDLLGVTNATILEAEPDMTIGMKGHHRHDAAWVLSQEPDVVILGNGLFQVDDAGEPELFCMPWERDLWESPEFRERWSPFYLHIPEDDPVLIFLRDGAPRPEGLWPA